MSAQPKLVVFSGAGISAESGLRTFRDVGGLWEGYDVMEVASVDGWKTNPDKVLRFYNLRRAQLKNVAPNAAHLGIKSLESKYEVQVITQNVDDLHERAGSSNILYLHGELKKIRSTGNSNRIIEWEGDLQLGDKCPENFQWRPHIVWFGEAVPMMETAMQYFKRADICLVIGTSLKVYPAAGLIEFCRPNCQIIYIDPNPNYSFELTMKKHVRIIAESAVSGMEKVLNELDI